VCRYDRPGTIRYLREPAITTRSTPVRQPRTLAAMADDLRALLRRSGIRGPYVLVGHSMGGMIVRSYAQRNRSDVAGLVLVDAFGTNIRRLFGRGWPAYLELLNNPGLPQDSDPRFERLEVDGAIDAVERGPRLPRVPLAVMSKTEPFGTPPGTPRSITAPLERAWPRVQELLVTLEPQTPHILATGSGHYVQMQDPDLTAATVRLIWDRARAAR
jgi:pimeloyl-ACP methyl ester carboxylesterase